uniref:Uncharacterized protein n=1 Tax=Bracon brevicornis TaxID=1563983 RepID=A0A6V7JNE6_9HYME
MNLSIVINPTDDHVSADVSLISSKPKAYIALSFDLNFEHNIPLSWCPQYQEVVVQHSTILPLERRDSAHKIYKERQRETVFHKGFHFCSLAFLCYTLSI